MPSPAGRLKRWHVRAPRRSGTSERSPRGSISLCRRPRGECERGRRRPHCLEAAALRRRRRPTSTKRSLLLLGRQSADEDERGNRGHGRADRARTATDLVHTGGMTSRRSGFNLKCPMTPRAYCLRQPPESARARISRYPIPEQRRLSSVGPDHTKQRRPAPMTAGNGVLIVSSPWRPLLPDSISAGIFHSRRRGGVGAFARVTTGGMAEDQVERHLRRSSEETEQSERTTPVRRAGRQGRAG